VKNRILEDEHGRISKKKWRQISCTQIFSGFTSKTEEDAENFINETKEEFVLFSKSKVKR
jgi:hypothetical protein